MIIFDNIIFSILKSGGISVVWKELLRRIIADRFNYLCLDFNNAGLNIFRQQLDIPTEHLISKYYPLFKIQRYINPVVDYDEKFLFHSSYYRTCSNNRAINITTVHDFTYEFFAKGLRKYTHVKQKYNAIRNSDYIICVSNNTKKDLLHFLPDIKENKIQVIHNGVSKDYCPVLVDDNKLPFKQNSYLVYVGARDWYKNFDFAVEVLAETNYNFVIVGSALTDKEISFLENKIKGRYKYLGRISNEDLNVVYNGAFSLIYPSEYEGFGIPIIEAQKAGCPVIALNCSSIPEVIGESSLLFQDLQPKNALEIIDRLSDVSYRSEVIENGYVNAGKYTWDKMYTEITDIYRKCLLE